MTEEDRNIHASGLVVAGCGVLLRGASGAGKSDLALRLMDGGAQLVGDDRLDLCVRGGRLYASAPQALAGLIEARGVGLLRVPFLAAAEMGCVFDLGPHAQIERLPEAQTVCLCGVSLPLFTIDGFAASAPALVRLLASGVRPLCATP